MKKYRMKEEDGGFGNNNTQRMSRERGNCKGDGEGLARSRRKTRQKVNFKEAKTKCFKEEVITVFKA